jgi:hypothetical protein
MSETQWPYILYFSLNQEKQDNMVSQTKVFNFACNDYISNSGCSGFQFLLASFQLLVFGDGLKASPLSSFESRWFHQ